jgi:Transferrin
VRLDDVRSFFGLTGLTPLADPTGYSYLCPDGHLQPLTVRNPCSWIAKPWPVIASRRSHADKVQDLFENIDVKVQWQQSLLMLLESYYVNITSLDSPMTIDDYLDKDSGYQSAHSFPACYPPRHIVYCTTSLIDFVKCSWLQEVSTVYGIEPNLQCIRGENLYRCLDDVNKNIADVVLVDQDDRVESERAHNLTSVLFEYSSNFTQNYVTIAVVKNNSWIKTISG